MKKFTRILERLAYKNRYVELYYDKVRRPNGQLGRYTRVRSHQNPPGVVVVPRFPDGRMLLVEICRYPFDSLSLEFPRGTAEANESPTHAAGRELFEETALRAQTLEPIGFLRPDTGIFETEAHVFFANIQDSDASLLKLEDEEAIAQSRLVTFEELKELIAGDKIRCGFTLGAFALMSAGR